MMHQQVLTIGNMHSEHRCRFYNSVNQINYQHQSDRFVLYFMDSNDCGFGIGYDVVKYK